MSIASEIDQALRDVAQDTSGNEFVVTFERAGSLDESTYPPTSGDPVRFTGPATQEMIADRDKDGTNVRDGDIMLMMSAVLEWVDGFSGVGDPRPENGDKVTVSGRTYQVETVEPYAPGGTALYYMVRARGA